MPRYNYSAVDLNGSERSGWFDAADVRQVAARLQEEGLFPLAVTLVANRPTAAAQATDQGAADAPSPNWAGVVRRIFRGRVRPRELAGLTRQLGALLRAGMPLLRGLEVLVHQERSPELRRVLESLARSIRSGDALSVGMEQEAGVVSRLYVNMVRAGEAGGVLSEVFERLAHFQEKSLKLRGKLTAALLYPLMVMGVATLILIGLLVFVVPKFQQIFSDLLKGAPLPLLTQGVLLVSDAVRHHALPGLVIIVIVGLALRAYGHTSRGAMAWADWSMRWPLLGDLWRKDHVARLSRTLGTLLSSGVPILPALLITRDTCDNARLSAALSLAHDRVKAGAPVARPMREATVFPPLFTSMIEVGEHTGRLPDMLHQIATIYEDEVDNAIAGLSSLIEPLLILLLAGVVGTIVLALFLPIVRIVQLLS
ncbi:MAG: type II secretion system F family protein [Opitutae bacterium]